MDLMVLERCYEQLSPNKTNNTYTFRGTFTQFGVRNRNGRIYEAKEFLPHVNSLQEKIKARKLMGELEHPTVFEVRLDQVSHLITEMTYDKANDRVVGTIQLLNTEKGKIAMALAEAGVPLHISSRASGRVKDDGVVELNQLYTYDLVCEPGFAEAQLDRVSESLNMDKAVLKGILNESFNASTPSLVFVNDSFGLSEDSNVKMYRVINSEKKTSNMSEIEQLKKLIAEKDSQIATLESKIQQRDEQYVAYLDKVADTITALEEKVNASPNVDEAVAKILESKLVPYINEFVDEHNALKAYSEYIMGGVAKLNKGVSKLHESFRDLKDYANYIAESSTAIENKQGTIEKYAAYLGEKLNASINYAESISEASKKLQKYVEYSVNETNKLADYTQYFGEQVSEKFMLLESAPKEKEEKKQATPINRIEASSYTQELGRKLDGILEGAIDTNRMDYVSLIPSDLKGVWSNLSESRKGEIRREALSYDLSDNSKIERFWRSRDMREESPKAAPLTESNKGNAGRELTDREKFIIESAKRMRF